MPPRLSRRAALGLALLPCPADARAAGLAAGAGAAGFAAEWRLFRSRFLLPEGRVVDTGNGGISHSEGQGWALLAAARAGDRASFELILAWTRRALARPNDTLLSWRFRPEAGGVDDPNNASDGDLMTAWALLEAAARWGEAEHAALGAAMARDILRLLVRQVGTETVLLPGAAGFETAGEVVLNPSYYAFPAFRVLARAVPDPLWLRLAADGIRLLRRARFGRWGLPPDWLALPRAGGHPTPAPGWPTRFSYDAVRVPLYLAWAGLDQEPAVLQAARFWSDPSHPWMPSWTDLTSNAISPYPATPGARAVARLASGPGAGASLPSVGQARDYYGAALTLLAHLARQDAVGNLAGP